MASIFISYRREDSRAMAGWIHADLRERYGKDAVFRDIDQIAPAVDFEKEIGSALRKCDVFVAIIGKDWLGAQPDGSRRISEPTDWIASELEMALRLSIPVVPVLVDRATMPSRAELPEKIRDLTRQQALPIDADSFERDVSRLHEVIDVRLPGPRPGPGQRPRPPKPPKGPAATTASGQQSNARRVMLITLGIIVALLVIAALASLGR